MQNVGSGQKEQQPGGPKVGVGLICQGTAKKSIVGLRRRGPSIKGKVLGPIHGIGREPQGATGGVESRRAA